MSLWPSINIITIKKKKPIIINNLIKNLITTELKITTYNKSRSKVKGETFCSYHAIWE